MSQFVSYQSKQPRDNRRNVNLTESEKMLFDAMSQITGTPIAIIIREFALRHAIRLIMDTEQSILDRAMNTGALEHLQRAKREGRHETRNATYRARRKSFRRGSPVT